MKTILYSLIVLFFIACSSENKSLDRPEYESNIVAVVAKDSVYTLNFNIRIELSLSGCDSYKRVEIEKIESNVLSFKVFANDNRKGNICPTSFFKYETDLSVLVEAKGIYNLVFNKGTLTKQVTVL